jgi:hypothetical protein
MIDINRHSSGIWRTFFIYDTYMRSDITAFLKKHQIVHSYSNYINNPKEKDHVSFRVWFDTEDQTKKLRLFLKKLEVKYDEKGYDEEQWVKMAYVQGTKMYYDWLECHDKIGDIYSLEPYLKLAIHGMLNDMHMNKAEELAFTMSMLQMYIRDIGIDRNG